MRAVLAAFLLLALVACDEDGAVGPEPGTDLGSRGDGTDPGFDGPPTDGAGQDVDDAGNDSLDSDSGGGDASDLGDVSATDGGGDVPTSDVDAGGDGSAEDVLEVVDDPLELVPRFAPFHPDGDFFRMPWPNDWRRQPDGRVDLSDFPRTDPLLLRHMIEVIEAEVDGFSTMPVVYVEFDQAVPDEALPSASVTLEMDASVQLIDLSHDGCGRRVPLVVTFDPEGHEYRPPNVLMGAPVVGFPLDPITPYGLVVTRDFGAEVGLHTRAPSEMGEVLRGEHADEALNTVYQPLIDCLGRDPTAGASLAISDVAVATVFTTQDPVYETRLMRDQVADPSRTEAPVVVDFAYDSDRSQPGRQRVYKGSYETPIFQVGNPPYNSDGGIELDDEGEPVVQRWERVPFSVTFPGQSEGDGPFPAIIWSDGTGATLFHHLGGEPVQDALAAGFAVATFAPQFHDERAVPGSDPVLHSFNFNNPESGRTVFRQQVVDTAYFVRVLREGVTEVDLDMPTLSTDRLLYGSHSQGSLVGAMVAGIEPEIDAFVLNGTGGYISETIIERKSPFDIEATLRTLLFVDEPLDLYHPVIQLVQMGADPVDNHNYARYWRGWPDHPSGSHVFLTNGMNDHTTPRRLIDMLTIAGDAAPLDPPGWDVDPHHVWSREPESLPIQGNRTALDDSPLTLGSYLDPETGHYTIYDVPEIRATAVGFWSSALEGVPRLE